MKFPEQLSSFVLSLDNGAVLQKKGAYIDTTSFIFDLNTQSTLPLKLLGAENPVLMIGKVSLKLGSRETPVRAANILTAPLLSQLADDHSQLFRPSTTSGHPGRVSRLVGASPEGEAKRGVSVHVTSPENSFYAVVLSQVNNVLVDSLFGNYEADVRPVQSGRLWLGSGLTPTRLVSSFADLQKAHNGKEQVALLLKITSGGDLRKVTYQLVPPREAQLVPALP